jgi:hypothetical protein
MSTGIISVKSNVGSFDRTLRKLQHQIGEYTIEATIDALNRIHEKAMKNLNEKLIWGHGVNSSDGDVAGLAFSAEEEQIENSVRFHIERIGGRVVGNIEYTSPHANLIEVGSIRAGVNLPITNNKPMPIGYREGHVEGFAYEVYKPVDGKYYLQRALMSESSSIKEIFQEYINLAALKAQK